MSILRFNGQLARFNGQLGRFTAPAAPPPEPVGDGTNVTLDDLTYVGAARVDNTDFSYCTGQVALRYVDGDPEPRLLISKWKYYYRGNNHQYDLVEFKMPTTMTTSTGTTGNVVTVRSWKDWHWVPTVQSDLDKLSNGWHIGSSMHFDQAQQVLWYTMWPEYLGDAGWNMPVLGATRLNDDGTVTQYGPWRYKTNSSSGSSWKRLCQGIIEVPPSMRAAFGGRTHLLSAQTIGASGGALTNWGPGGVVVNLPALDSTEPIEPGIPFADYSYEGGLAHPYNHCDRMTDYTSWYGAGPDGGAIPGPWDGRGYWQASSDKAHPACWLDGNRKGLLMFGQLTHNQTWYGLDDAANTYDAQGNYLGRTPIDPPDTMMPTQGSSGYHSNGWRPAAFVFEHQHIVERAAGTRPPHSFGMKPTLISETWNTTFPNIARPSKQPYVSAHEGFAYDRTKKRLYWVHSQSRLNGCCAVNPVVHVFDVNE